MVTEEERCRFFARTHALQVFRHPGELRRGHVVLSLAEEVPGNVVVPRNAVAVGESLREVALTPFAAFPHRRDRFGRRSVVDGVPRARVCRVGCGSEDQNQQVHQESRT